MLLLQHLLGESNTLFLLDTANTLQSPRARNHSTRYWQPGSSNSVLLHSTREHGRIISRFGHYDESSRLCIRPR